MSRSPSQLRWRLAVPAGLLLANLAILLTQVAWLRLVAGGATNQQVAEALVGG